MKPKGYRRSTMLCTTGLFPAQEQQAARIAERKSSQTIYVTIQDTEFEVSAGVYRTGIDTQLMSRVVRVRNKDRVLEVGCGCGAVPILLAQKCQLAIGVDINPRAVDNARRNAIRLGVSNAQFYLSDVFENVTGEFDKIVCNPPYNLHSAKDVVEKMFWDPQDDMKRKFFQNVRSHLRKDGEVYFGWANFTELEGAFPLRMAAEAGLRYIKHFSLPSRSSAQTFYVIKFRPV